MEGTFKSGVPLFLPTVVSRRLSSMLVRKTMVSTRRVDPSALWRVPLSHSMQLLAAPDMLHTHCCNEPHMLTRQSCAFRSDRQQILVV